MTSPRTPPSARARRVPRARRAIRALRGAFAFLTRLPVSVGDERDWEAFGSSPWTFPVVGLVVGGFAALPLLASGTLPSPTVALGFVLAIYLLTGVHHLDGAADLGDATAVHGSAERRRAALKDTTTGVGALLAVVLVVAALALGGLALAGAPVLVAVAVVIGAEVGAKLSMAAMACLGSAAHEGFGSHVVDRAGPSALALPAAFALVAALALPSFLALYGSILGGTPWNLATGSAACAVGPPGGVVALAALGGALVGGSLPWLWAARELGGVSGDVFGAANEVGRVVGLHAGVIAWTLC